MLELVSPAPLGGMPEPSEAAPAYAIAHAVCDAASSAFQRARAATALGHELEQMRSRGEDFAPGAERRAQFQGQIEALKVGIRTGPGRRARRWRTRC